MLAQQNEPDAKLNLIGTSYNLTTGNSGTGVVFTAYRGFSGFATTNSYLQTGFNPTTAPSPHFTQNSASFGVWVSGSLPGNSAAEIAAGAENQINDDVSGASFYARINEGSSGPVTSPNAIGLYSADRDASSTGLPYYNGNSIARAGITSISITSASFAIGQYVGGGASTDQQLAEAHIGASLGSAGNLALYNRLRTYMTAVGVP